MASNAYFLPKISHAISISWPQYTQSPSLKTKLAYLARVPMIDEAAANTMIGIVGRLSKVVQTRLWSMMQRQLYNPSTTKALRWKDIEDCTPTPGGNDLQQEDLFYLVSAGDADAEDFAYRDILHPGRNDDGDYMSDFEDLLGDDGGDEKPKLDYWEQQRIETERQTDEMLLLGHEWEREADNSSPDEVITLLDHTTRKECMLV
jgi:hypothetical protein